MIKCSWLGGLVSVVTLFHLVSASGEEVEHSCATPNAPSGSSLLQSKLARSVVQPSEIGDDKVVDNVVDDETEVGDDKGVDNVVDDEVEVGDDNVVDDEAITREIFSAFDLDDSLDVTAFELFHGWERANVSHEGDESNTTLAEAEEYVSTFDQDHSLSLTLDEFLGKNATTEDMGPSLVQGDNDCRVVRNAWKWVSGPYSCHCRGCPRGYNGRGRYRNACPCGRSCGSRRRSQKLVEVLKDAPIKCLAKALEDFDFVYKEDCASGAALSTPCSDLEKVSAKLLTENNAVPEEWAARVIDEVAQEAGVLYNDPKLSYDLAQAENMITLADQMIEGYVTLNPNPPMREFVKGVDTADEFTEKLKIGSNTKSWKKLVSSGLDVIGTIAGPTGVAVSIVSAVLDFSYTADAKTQQELLAKKIYEEVMKEVEKLMLNSNAAAAQRFYNEQRDEILGWLQAFQSEYKTAIEQVKAIRQAKMAHAGLTQFLLLNSLMMDVGSSRFQWLKGFSGGYNCSFTDLPNKCSWKSWDGVPYEYGPRRAFRGSPSLSHPNKVIPGFGDYGSSSCVMFRNHLILFVAPLISLHLSLIHSMAILATGVGGMSGVLQGKLYEMAAEYLAWTNKFERSRCWNQVTSWFQGIRYPCNKPDKIMLCAPFPCAKYCTGKIPGQGCDMGDCAGSQYSEDWPIWDKILRLRGSLQGLLDKRPPVSLVLVNRTQSRHRAFEGLKRLGTVAVAFGEICGGFECLAGETSEAQREALRALAHRSAADLLG